jgi:hypothetical protein
MQFQCTKNKLQICKALVVPKDASNIRVSNICEVAKNTMPLEESERLIYEIEHQVKQQQQIVAEWDRNLEMMRTRDIEMRRCDVIREFNNLIAIWNVEP